MPTRLSVLGVRIPEKAIQRRRVLPVALAILGALTALEWYIHIDFSLGIFYTVPVVVAATALNRSQIIMFAVLCAAVRSFFVPAASDVEFFLKFLMAGIAYCGSGLLVVEMSNNRRRVIEHYARLKTRGGAVANPGREQPRGGAYAGCALARTGGQPGCAADAGVRS